MSTLPEVFLTEVVTTSQEDWFNCQLLFGKPIKNVNNSHYFAPGSIFALDLCYRNEFGITQSAIYVLQAAKLKELIIPIPQVKPGAKVLLEAYGKKRTEEARSELLKLQREADLGSLPSTHFLLLDFKLKASTRNRCFKV